MSTINQTFVIPFDGSLAAIRAAHLAIDIAKYDHSQLIFAYNFGSDSNEDNFISHELKTKLQVSQIKYKTIIRYGGLMETINDIADEYNADMIVMGTNGDHDHVKQETNTSELIQNAKCTVLVVPVDGHYDRINKVALACDFNTIKDSNVLKDFWTLARKMKAQVRIVFVNAEGKEVTEFWNQEVDKTMSFYFEDLEYEYDILHGNDIEEQLRTYVKQKHIDLLGFIPRNHEPNRVEGSQGQLTKLFATDSNIPILAMDS